MECRKKLLYVTNILDYWKDLLQIYCLLETDKPNQTTNLIRNLEEFETLIQPDCKTKLIDNSANKLKTLGLIK
jgi:hypothetical protein